jgi:hypothetical protein
MSVVKVIVPIVLVSETNDVSEIPLLNEDASRLLLKGVP